VDGIAEAGAPLAISPSGVMNIMFAEENVSGFLTSFILETFHPPSAVLGSPTDKAAAERFAVRYADHSGDAGLRRLRACRAVAVLTSGKDVDACAENREMRRQGQG
jgi:hypothetical protein